MVRPSQHVQETREPYAFLKAKKIATTWKEDGRLYRVVPTGLTVLRLRSS